MITVGFEDPGYNELVYLRVKKNGDIFYKAAPGAGDHDPEFEKFSGPELEDLLSIVKPELQHLQRKIKALLKRL